MNKLAAFAIAAATLTTALAPGYASACGMSVRMARPVPAERKAPPPSPVLLVAEAERVLDAGQPVAAARKILATFPSVRSEEAGKDPLRTRALRVFALAMVRADGNVPLGGEQTWARNANLEWAAEALREIDAKRPNDPALQADMGEALARLPRAKDEAFKLLDGLAQKDLMGSPQAYAALSRLRAGKGDNDGASLAMKRCEAMAHSPALCAGTVPVTKTASIGVPRPTLAMKARAPSANQNMF